MFQHIHFIFKFPIRGDSLMYAGTIKAQNENLFVNLSITSQIENQQEKPTVLELFAGGGGMALGFEQAGFQHVLLNEVNRRCCETLRLNRPDWPVEQADISTIDFSAYRGKVDVVAGGFPCQAFSVAGKQQGFSDKRGALFFEYARAIREIKPKLFIAENVKGLLFHDKGKTLEVILETLSEAGYKVFQPQLLKAINYRVPQKRERVFIVGIRNDIDIDFNFPIPEEEVYTVHDALKAGKLFNNDVPHSVGMTYSEYKYKILAQVPEGGNWRDLPIDLQKEYAGKFYGQSSNSQLARRLSWDKPSYTLLTNPNSKLTERCHPNETRPLTIRESARIQTFPDEWEFAGAKSAQYSQIGNAVPVNLAKAVAQSASAFLSKLSSKNQPLVSFIH